MPQAKVDIFEKDGEWHISGMAITTKEVSEKELHMLHKRMINQNVTYRHVTPYEEPFSEIVASVDTSEIQDFVDDDGVDQKGIFVDCGLYNDTKFQKNALELAKLKDEVDDPISFSMGKQTFGENGKPPKNAVPLELGLTSNPVCTTCTTKVTKMEDDEKMARIKELEVALNKAVNKASQIEKLEKELEAFKADEERVKASTESFEDKLKAVASTYEEKLVAVNASMKKLETELSTARKEPIFATIAKYETDTWLVENVYSGLSEEKLKERAEYLEKTKPSVAPIVKRFEHNRPSGIDEAFTKKLEGIDPLIAKAISGKLTDEERIQLGRA